MELNKIYLGDCIQVLRTMPDGLVDCCVTSPPYYGLRDYGTASWEGGDDGCDHLPPNQPGPNAIVGNTTALLGRTPYKDSCKKCGAVRIDSQIGLEETPESYVQKLVEVFREVKRVLKKDGTLWLNIGDSYNGSGQDSGKKIGTQSQSIAGKRKVGDAHPTKAIRIQGIKPKDLIGIPWMLAFALRADGWYLRQDIIWNKPNPMPESVTDRCTKAHEYIFLLSKSQKYYYDNEAIFEDCITGNGKQQGVATGKRFGGQSNAKGFVSGFGERVLKNGDNGRNKRSVWTVTTKPYTEAHFATYPEDLISPCILAGCPENGVVLDPFMGAGTTGLVARKLNRNFIGIELNAEYKRIADERIMNEIGLFF